MTRGRLRQFWEAGHGDAMQPLCEWMKQVKAARWHGPADVKTQFRTASLISARRFVFNIKGNKYRLIVDIRYDFQTVYVRFIGTHAEYDRINAEEI